MFTQIRKFCVPLFFLALALPLSATAQGIITQQTNIYYFQQTGWAGGGVLSGSFIGIGGGVIDDEAGDILAFSASLTGNSYLGNINMSYSDASYFSLVYDTAGGSTLGDWLYEGIDFVGVGPEYRTGNAFAFGVGGLFRNSSSGLLDATPNPIMITSVVDIQSVPEPSSMALVLLGALSLLIPRRRSV